MDAKTVTLAGGSGFIGRAIARRLLASGEIRLRVLTRNPEAARARLDYPASSLFAQISDSLHRSRMRSRARARLSMRSSSMAIRSKIRAAASPLSESTTPARSR